MLMMVLLLGDDSGDGKGDFSEGIGSSSGCLIVMVVMKIVVRQNGVMVILETLWIIQITVVVVVVVVIMAFVVTVVVVIVALVVMKGIVKTVE